MVFIARLCLAIIKGLRQALQHGFYKVRIGSQCIDSRYLEKGLYYRLKAGIARTDVSTTNFAELTQIVPVNRGMWYMASVYMGNHRSVKTELIIQYVDANGTAISATHKTGGNGFSGLETAERVFIKFQALANCEKVRFYLRQTGIARNNTNAIMFVARPMLEECTQYTTAPSAWVNSGVTSIHGGSIVTDSITADKIGAGQVTTAHMITGSIDGKVLRAGTVTADKVVASVSLSSPKISGGSFTGNTFTSGSISGTTITGRNINGNSISGGAISGTTVSGSTISGGVIKGARFEGATGKFTGELEVTQLIGGGVIEQVSGTLKYESSGRDYVGQESGKNSSSPIYEHYVIYSATVTISAAATDRYITFLGVNAEAFILPKNTSKTIKVSSRFAGSARERKPAFMMLSYAISTAKTISIS